MERRMLDDPPHLCRHAAPAGDAVFLGEPQHLLGIEATGRPEAPEAGRDRGDGAGVQAGDVEQGTRGQPEGRVAGPVAGGGKANRVASPQDEGAADIGEEVAMGGDRTLGSPGRAGGEQDRRRIVLGDRGVGQRRGRELRHQRGEVVLHHEHRHPGVVGEAFESPTVGDQDLGRGQVEAVADLVAGPPPVHGHHDGTLGHGGPERLDPLRRVGAEDRDPVAGTDAVAVVQRRGQRRGRPDVVGERRLAAVVEEVVAGVALAVVRRSEQELAQVRHPVLDHPHLDAVDRLHGGLEETALPGEEGVDFGDRHRGVGGSHRRRS